MHTGAQLLIVEYQRRSSWYTRKDTRVPFQIHFVTVREHFNTTVRWPETGALRAQYRAVSKTAIVLVCPAPQSRHNLGKIALSAHPLHLHFGAVREIC